MCKIPSSLSASSLSKSLLGIIVITFLAMSASALTKKMFHIKSLILNVIQVQGFKGIKIYLFFIVAK